MSLQQMQNTWTLGELDPILEARVDFEGYYKGARKIRDALVIPQGGIINRFGTLFTNVVFDNNGNAISDETHLVEVLFTYSSTKNYLFIIRPTVETNNPTVDTTTIDVYLDRVYLTSVAAPWTVSQLEGMGLERAPDRTLFLTNDTPPYAMVNGGNDVTWTLAPMPILYYPQFDFSTIDGGVAIYTGSTVTFTPSATTGNVTITVANATPVTSNHIGGLYVGNGGVLRITAVASTSSFSGFTITDFTNTNAIRGDRSLLTEPMWGNGGGVVPGIARKWPRVGAIFQNRLWLATTPTLPNVLAASKSFFYGNFDTSEADDDSAFSYGLGGDQLDEINHLIGTNSLVAITTNSLYSTNVLMDVPLTPSNMFMLRQSSEGSNRVLPWLIDDQILFVDDHGKTVKSVEYDLLQSRLKTTDASLLAPHLIREPREAAIFTNSFKSQGNFYFLINGQDGTLATYQTLADQNVAAWSLQSTQGEFLDVTANRSQCFVITRRQISGVGPNQVVLRTNPDFDNFTDISLQARDPDPISGVQLFVNTDSTQPDVSEWTGDYLVFGNSSPFQNIGLGFLVGASADIQPTFEYLGYVDNEFKWMTIENVQDTTLGFTQDGALIWSVEDTPYWVPAEVNGIERKFWIRVRKNISLTAAQLPFALSVQTDRQEALFIEQVMFDYLMDCSVEVTSDADGNIALPQYLSGQQVWALQQTTNTYNMHAGIPRGKFLVDDLGMINVGEDWANLNWVVGLWRPPLIELMPPVANLNDGLNVYRPKYISAMYLDYYQSAGIVVNNWEIPVLQVGGASVNIPLELKSGFFDVTPMADRDPRVIIPITTTNPLPFTLRGVGYLVEV